MNSLDYTYRFDAITDSFSQVEIVDHSRNTDSRLIQVAIEDFSMFFASNKQMPAIIADLIDIAVAISIADRMSVRRNDMPCRIHINLPVRHPEILDRPDVQEKLQYVLGWYTNDQWFFTFTNYIKNGRAPELQMFLTENYKYPTSVTLWSGGLDALAGLYNHLTANTSSHYTLFGAGSNNVVFRSQKQIADDINAKFPNRTRLIQTPIRLNQSKDLTKNFNQRARGLVFLLQGVACSYLLDQRTLYVYENGVGAINLPFTKSEVGLDHSRSVHPLSLHYVSELVSDILQEPFSIENPFVLSTKAQMCSKLKVNNDTDLIFHTSSCDRRHRKKISQCGYCSSCLLRRQALEAQHIKDETRYISKDLASKRQKIPDDRYYNAMLFQVEDLRNILGQVNPWESLAKNYSSLQEVVDRTTSGEEAKKEKMKEKLLTLYECYVDEWDIARTFIEPEFSSDRAST